MKPAGSPLLINPNNKFTAIPTKAGIATKICKNRSIAVKIAIIGAGQAGLQLGIGLQKNGISTTIYSEYFAEAISSGYITSSQVMFHTALSYEKELDLNLWENEAPKIVRFGFPSLDKFWVAKKLTGMVFVICPSNPLIKELNFLNG